MTPLRFNDRVLVIGKTGSGKSELINQLFSAFAGGAQRLLIDTKGEFALPDTPRVRDVESIDWSLPLIHYVTRGGVDEMQDLFSAAFDRRRLITAVHELSDVCDFNAAKTPPAFNEYVSKGRALGLGLLAGTQRPFNIPSRARSEADHVYAFVPRFPLEQDNKATAQALGIDPRILGSTLDEVQDKLGNHSFIYRSPEGTIEACPPLTSAERRGVIVKRPKLY